MKNVKGIAVCVLNLMVVNTIAATGAFAADNTSVLLKDVKTLQTGIDSGALKTTDAVDQFSQAIVDQNISMDDVNAFVKTQMTDTQFRGFQSKMNSALRGIDPSTLTADETGQIVGQALADIHTEGLYWNG